MGWFKEEITNRQELYDTIKYVFDKYYYNTARDKINNVTNNIMDTLHNRQKMLQLQNPVVSYTFYLIFEELFLQDIFEEMIYHRGETVPIWIYKYGGVNVEQTLSVAENGAKYYSMILKDSPISCGMGEFEEFAEFIKKYQPKRDFVFEYEKEFFESMKLAIINPDWKEELGNDSMWNKMYDADDWLSHNVL